MKDYAAEPILNTVDTFVVPSDYHVAGNVAYRHDKIVTVIEACKVDSGYNSKVTCRLRV